MSININDLKNTISTSKTSDNSPLPVRFVSLHQLLKKQLFTKQSLSTKQKARFFTDIGTLLGAGVDLKNILLIADAKNSKSDSIFKQISGQVLLGISISESMGNTGKFTNFDCYSVLIGENTGELAKVFSRLGDYYVKRSSRQRKIRSALSYPIIVLATTIGAIYFMLNFVVPMFAQTITKFGGELPKLTRVIISLSDSSSQILGVATLMFLVTFALWFRFKNNPDFQRISSNIVLKTPILGKYIYKASIVEFTTAMSLLLGSKITIVDSLYLAIKITGFYPLKNCLERIVSDISMGDSFYHSMEKQAYFDDSMIALVKIGEEVNQLDRIFTQLSKQTDEELEYESAALLSTIEPLVIIALALIVGVILVAMYMPMFKIGTIIGR